MMEEENRFVSFLSKHWSKLLTLLLILGCLAVWAERRYRSGDQQEQQDFLFAHQIFERFQKGDPLTSESIEMTENLLSRHPELHPKYDALLALTFFSQAKEEEGLNYAQASLKRVEKELPLFFRQYAHCTLLIEGANYLKAYQEALSLHEQLKTQPEYQILDAMNTLRLLFLTERLAQTSHPNAEEVAALPFEAERQKHYFWNELKQHPGFKEISPLFQEGVLSLDDYMNNKAS